MNLLQNLFNLVKNFFLVKCIHRPHFDKEKITIKWYCPIQPLHTSIEPFITWVGQATFLIQIDGINILTDPNFFNTSVFYKRLIPPGISINKLPHIHVIAISHNHIDHMDKKSLLALQHYNPLILAPLGDGKWFSRRKFKNVIENKWGDHRTITTQSGKSVSFTYLPATHWTGRSLFDFNKSLHGSWMIEHDSHTIYFAGDSAYDTHFNDIAKDFNSIHTAILPIGPVEPRNSIKHAHLDGQQAVQAFIDLKAQQFIPMHWGTFQFGSEKFEVPIKILEKSWQEQEKAFTEKKLLILKFGKGEHLTLPSKKIISEALMDNQKST